MKNKNGKPPIVLPPHIAQQMQRPPLSLEVVGTVNQCRRGLKIYLDEVRDAIAAIGPATAENDSLLSKLLAYQDSLERSAREVGCYHAEALSEVAVLVEASVAENLEIARRAIKDLREANSLLQNPGAGA